MTAKEMFESLGWEECTDKWCICSYVKEFKYATQWITFTKEGDVVFETSPEDTAPGLTYEEIKAIEKQFEEILEKEGK